MQIINAEELIGNIKGPITNLAQSPTLFAIDNILMSSIKPDELNCNTQIINFNSGAFPTLNQLLLHLASIYKDLSLVESILFWSSLQKCNQELKLKLNLSNLSQNPELFFSQYGFRYNENLFLLINKIVKLPEIFQAWTSLKKWGPQDFAPLRSVNDEKIPNLTPFLIKISEGIISKSDSTIIFEYLIELYLMEYVELSNLLKTPIQQWLTALKKWRFPLQTKLQNKEEHIISKIHWPANSQAKWIQKGDRSGIELKFFFSHTQELDRILQKLETINDSFKTNDEIKKLWTL